MFRYLTPAHLLLLLLLLAELLFLPRGADSQAAPKTKIMRVNRQFGTVSTEISRIFFNLKPFIIVKNIDFSTLTAANDALVTREASTIKLFTKMNDDVTYRNNKLQLQAVNLFKFHQSKISTSAGHPFKENYNKFKNFMSQLQTEQPLAVAWSPDYVKTHSNETADRNKRFVGPVIAAVMGVAKLVGPAVCTAVLHQTAEVIARKGVDKTAAAITRDRPNFLLAPDKREDGLSDDDSGGMDFNKIPFNRGHASYKSEYGMYDDDANILKYTEMLAYTKNEADYLNNQRQIMILRNNQMMDDILSIQKGVVPHSLFPVSELRNMLSMIDKLVTDNKMPVQHIARTTAPYDFYRFITPLLVVDNDNHKLLLILILPLVPEGPPLTLYQVATIPFMTRENVTLEVSLPEDLYAADMSGGTHALLSRADYDSCTRTDDISLCRIGRPTIKKKSECFNALHFEGYKSEDIFKACQFKKADGDTPRFLYISPNTYAYFLPAPGMMLLNCPGVGHHNATELPRSGIFSFPDRCYATIGDHDFFDTSVETVNITVMPQQKLFSFLSIARSAWPALYPSIEAATDLLTAARDNNFSEPLTTLTTRARVYDAFRNLGKIEETNATSKGFFDQLWYYVAAISVFVTCNLLAFLWQCIFRRLPDKRKYNLSKFRRNKLRGQPDTVAFSRESDEISIRRLRGCDAKPPSTKRPTENVYALGHPETANDHRLFSPSAEELAAHSRDIDLFEAQHTYQTLTRKTTEPPTAPS